MSFKVKSANKIKKRRGDDRDGTTLLIREINRYVEDHPELKEHYLKFKDYVFDRMDSMTTNIFTARENRGITSMDDPQYRVVEEVIESAYPTWDRMRELIIAGKQPEFPTLPKHVLDGKAPLGQY